MMPYRNQTMEPGQVGGAFRQEAVPTTSAGTSQPAYGAPTGLRRVPLPLEVALYAPLPSSWIPEKYRLKSHTTARPMGAMRSSLHFTSYRRFHHRQSSSRRRTRTNPYYRMNG